MKHRLPIFLIVLILIALAGVGLAQEKVGTGFTYQGFLNDGGVSATGNYDFEFSLFDAATIGNQIGTTLTQYDVAVEDGLFWVVLDFGSDVFAGNARWLQIGVRPGTLDTVVFTTLSPRQELTPAPNAMRADFAPRADRVSPPADTTVSTVDMDDIGTLGQYTSITIGTDGLGLISYLDYSNNALKVAHCNNLECSSATSYTLDDGGDVGEYTSIAIGADGLGLISYHQYGSGASALKVAHCNDTACTTATTSTLDTGNVGRFTSLTFGSDGFGLISYYDDLNGHLKVARCYDTECTSFSTDIIDNTQSAGKFSSIALGADGLGLISYYDVHNGDLKVAHCGDPFCQSADRYVLEDIGDENDLLQASPATSVTIGADGLGIISYHDFINGNLKVAHCNNIYCSSATTNTIADGAEGTWGASSSITIGADGLAIISYYGDHWTLKAAHCNDTVCTNASTAYIDQSGDVGMLSSVTLGADGFPLISYYDDDTNDLKVAHCSNTFCTPYFRRR